MTLSRPTGQATCGVCFVLRLACYLSWLIDFLCFDVACTEVVEVLYLELAHSRCLLHLQRRGGMMPFFPFSFFLFYLFLCLLICFVFHVLLFGAFAISL